VIANLAAAIARFFLTGDQLIAAAKSELRQRAMRRAEALPNLADLRALCQLEYQLETREFGGVAFFAADGTLLDFKPRLFCGGADSVYLDAGVIGRSGLLCGAASVALVHNHPFGVAKPSVADIQKHAILRLALATLGITVSDNLIIGGDGQVFSFRDSGLLDDAPEVDAESSYAGRDDRWLRAQGDGNQWATLFRALVGSGEAALDLRGCGRSRLAAINSCAQSALGDAETLFGALRTARVPEHMLDAAAMMRLALADLAGQAAQAHLLRAPRGDVVAGGAAAVKQREGSPRDEACRNAPPAV
jgi:hypothetical protein